VGSLTMSGFGVGTLVLEPALGWVAQLAITLYLTEAAPAFQGLAPQLTAFVQAVSMDAQCALAGPASSLKFSPTAALRRQDIFLADVAASLALQQSNILSYWPASSYLTTFLATPALASWIISLDPALLGAELFFIGVVCIQASQWVSFSGARQLFYDDLVTLCKYNNLSLTELAVTVTLTVGFIFFDIFISFSEEDVFDTLNYLILLFISLTFVFILVAVDIQYFFMISNAGGDFTLRVVCFDLINNVLCAFRVVFCWIRYIFYDLQVELVDMTFQYTDAVNDMTLLHWFDIATSQNGSGQAPSPSLWVSLSALA